jgi:hypothetical protein
MEISPDKQKLMNLVEGARKGKIVLPQFQRSFVWSREDITDLLGSILKGYYIGSFLMLRTDIDSNPFGVRAIEGVKLDNSSLRPELIVLDGQQRLTSLHYVFAAPEIPLKWTKYPYRFFLNLKKIIKGEIEEAIESKRADWCEEDLNRSNQFQTLIIPFTEIENWEDWLNSYEQWLIDKDKDQYFNKYFKKRKPLWNKIVSNIHQFQVPTIELPKVLSDDYDKIS